MPAPISYGCWLVSVSDGSQGGSEMMPRQARDAYKRIRGAEITDCHETGRHYYAMWWAYGIGVCYESDDGSSWPVGDLAVFGTRAARDRWIDEAEDYRGGNAHTATISSALARRIMVDDLRSPLDAWAQHFGDLSPRDVPMGEIVGAWLGETARRW